jgi:hypothetical protein
MRFHQSNYGMFGRSLPADRNGYVTCAPRKVRACVNALRAGREPSTWADTGANLLVARAEMAIAEWRK